ncbi:MAG: MBL fold metallo-hydrolase, partial [Rubrivivax sp.]
MRSPIRSRILAVLLLAMLVAGPASAAAEARAFEITEVAPGVHVHQGLIEDWLPGNGGDVANLGFIVGERCVAVIDTGGTPAVGRALKAAVERTTRLPVCYVIHTHAHPDHVLGGSVFVAPGTRFVGHTRMSAALAAREPYLRNALQRDFGIELPAGGIA